MKLTLHRNQLLPALQRINSIITGKTMPILANVLLQSKGETLTLTGSNLETQIVSTIKTGQSLEFETTINAKKLLNIAKLSPANAELKFDISPDKIKIATGRSRFNLATLPADAFPEFDKTSPEHTVTVAIQDLKIALDKAIFCAASNDVRYYLNGILLMLSDGKLSLTASDGHRLAIVNRSVELPDNTNSQLIIPRAAAIELSKLLNGDEQATLEFNNHNIKVSLPDAVFSSRLIDAKYPRFDQVFNKPLLPSIKLSTEELKVALQRVSIVSGEQFRMIRLNVSKDALKLSANTPENDTGEESIGIAYDGDKFEIGANVNYLIEALAYIDAKEVRINIAENLTVILIDDPFNDSYRLVVMPARL